MALESDIVESGEWSVHMFSVGFLIFLLFLRGSLFKYRFDFWNWLYYECTAVCGVMLP